MHPYSQSYEQITFDDYLLATIQFRLCCLFFFFYWHYNPLWVCILQPSSGAIAFSRTRFLDHIQRRATVGMTPLDE